MNKVVFPKLREERLVLTKSRAGFQRILQGPKKGFIARGLASNKYLMRFATGLGVRKITSSPFKIIGRVY